MFYWTLLRQVYHLCSGDYREHYWRNTKSDIRQVRRNPIIMIVLLLALGMALFFLLHREPSIVCLRCSLMTSTSSHKCARCGYLIPYMEGNRMSSIDHVRLEEDREYFNTAHAEWIWTAHYYIYIIPMTWRRLQEYRIVSLEVPLGGKDDRGHPQSRNARFNRSRRYECIWRSQSFSFLIAYYHGFFMLIFAMNNIYGCFRV